jgi:hypothetical protein
MAETDKAYVAALLREREALSRQPGEEHRVAEIDAELKRAGYVPEKAAAPQGRTAAQRETATPGTRKAAR